MKKYFDGKELFGDNFTNEQIETWYNDETEGYSELGSKNKAEYRYSYHYLNLIHGYNKLKQNVFENVLGLGSAYGFEFEPIINRISNVTIIEPSDLLVNNKIGGLIPKYVKPNVNGDLPFNDNSFELITCFSTLHHIPNVSHVISELIRVLKPNSYLLIREPIISMGDWRNHRFGLTKNERGIPLEFFDKIFRLHKVEVVSKQHHFTATAMLQRTFGFLFKHPIFSYKSYIILDKFISKMLSFNTKYHATNKLQRISPQAIFYVIKKM
jgi:SAM-dependent methyltransferase